MSSFLDLLGDGGHVHFEKCGDVVVSPKDNMVAMFCHFCRDIFTHLPEFMRHLQWSHSDVLTFTKEQNVYRVEELMSLESSEEDTQSQANSCSSGDSGLAGEMEDADAGPGSSECLANNVDIMNALAAFDVEVDGLNANHEWFESKTLADCQTKEIGKICAARNILAEVEAILLENEKDISPSVINKPGYQTVKAAESNIPAVPIIAETPIKKTYCKVNYTENEIEAHISKGFRRVRKPESVDKPPSICDLKSYNIIRHRKREAIKQRLGSVKKRIMLSLENDVPRKTVLMNQKARCPPVKGSSVKQELPSFKKESKDSVVAEATKLSLDKLESKENRSVLTHVIQSSEIKSASMNHLIKPKTSSITSLLRTALTFPKPNSSPSNKAKQVLSNLTNPNSTANGSTPLIKPSIPASQREPLAKNEPKTYMRSPKLNKPQSKVNELCSNSLSPIISSSPKQSKMSALLKGSSVNEPPACLEAPKPLTFDSATPKKKLYVPSIKSINKPILPRPSTPTVKTDPNICKAPVCRRSPNVRIERVKILPKINVNQIVEMSQLKTTNNDAVDQPKRPVRRSSLTVVSSSPIQAQKPTRRSSTTTVKPTVNTQLLRSAPVESLAKAKKRSNDSFGVSTCSTENNGDVKRTKIEQEICSMNFSLSASVIDYLQSDLNTSKLDADSLLQLAEPRESDAFENILVKDQVKRATKEGSPQKMESPAPQTGAKPEIEALREDLKLLETVGLLIIKVPCFEDKLPLEQSEEFRKKAANFSKIYHTYDTIWSYRKTKTIGAPQRLIQMLNSFTEEVNKEIGCHLTTNEMKRILNLINSWYGEQINQRFFRKAILSYSVEHYMLLFQFLPKIIPSVYFCEHCEETFPNEPRYKKHVQSLHAVHAFTCSECGKFFKRLYFYEKHLKTVHPKP
ncbi:protein teflon [Drosophila obscura]|uniref:protein teflon n=1 Tax=Drosophila obscura TaxID=7282 RepID=UPI001BB182CB|nr:protein teflon [Drosophila obscura]